MKKKTIKAGEKIGRSTVIADDKPSLNEFFPALFSVPHKRGEMNVKSFSDETGKCDVCFKRRAPIKLFDCADGSVVWRCEECAKLPTDCCPAWTLSGEADTEDHGGRLRQTNVDGDAHIMGIRLPLIKFCPWCGAKK
jgi:hypothetical protein